MPRFFLTIFLILVCLSPVSAQSLTVPTTFYTAAMVADWTTAAMSIPQYGPETDPLAKPFVGRGLARGIMGAAIDTAVTVLVVKFLGRHHPTLTRDVLWIGTSVRVGTALSNLQRPMPCQPFYPGECQ